MIKKRKAKKLKKRKVLSVWGIAGAVIGGVLGFIYYRYVGCATGNCPIASNPWLMISFGMMLGAIITWR